LAPMPSLRPISFTSESVNEIARALKTQTRRVIYPQPTGDALTKDAGAEWPRGGKPRPINNKWIDAAGKSWRCPYGDAGDRLWVREIWARVEPYPTVMEDYRMPVDWRVEKTPLLLEYWRKRVIFLADYPGKMPEDCGCGATDNAWRTPLSMPRWAARLHLGVTEVRTARLQSVSAADCEAEGIAVYKGQDWMHAGHDKATDRIYLERFKKRWDSINGTKNPWSANPMVWAVSFKMERIFLFKEMAA